MPASNLTVRTVPALLALALRPLPLHPLQPPLSLLLRRMRDRHPGVFERLGPHAAKRFGLDPTDLPFAFVLEPLPQHPKGTVVRSLPSRLAVRIAGPLAGLVGLVDGTYDGDALFFSRDLEIEGDMEAVLALRNAVDDARIDLLGEGLGWLGPLAAPIARIVRSRLAGPWRPEGVAWS